MKFKLTSEFPLLKKYKEKFAINENTIFAYDSVIYTNYDLPEHLIIHEQTHLKQQERYGLANWVNAYLEDSEFRLKMEIEAYRKQLASVKDRNERNNLKIKCCQDLSSALYGNLLTYNLAFKKL
jgi:hypothetical protein